MGTDGFDYTVERRVICSVCPRGTTTHWNRQRQGRRPVHSGDAACQELEEGEVKCWLERWNRRSGGRTMRRRCFQRPPSVAADHLPTDRAL